MTTREEVPPVSEWTALRDVLAPEQGHDRKRLAVVIPGWVEEADPAARPSVLISAADVFIRRAVVDGPATCRDVAPTLVRLAAEVAADLDPVPPSLDGAVLSVLALESALACAGFAPDDEGRRLRWLGAYGEAAETLPPLTRQEALVAAAGAGATEAAARLAPARARRGRPRPANVEDVATYLAAGLGEPSDVDATWAGFREAFPSLNVSGHVTWDELHWVARAVLHQRRGVPVGDVLATLHAEVLP